MNADNRTRNIKRIWRQSPDGRAVAVDGDLNERSLDSLEPVDGEDPQVMELEPFLEGCLSVLPERMERSIKSTSAEQIPEEPMIELIPTGFDDRVLGLRISGPIERADLDTVADAFEDKLKRHKRLRIFAEVRDMGGISISALIEDLRLSLRHFKDVEREAIVADADWLALLARAGDLLPGNLLPGIEVRQFSWLEKDKALAWINADGPGG